MCPYAYTSAQLVDCCSAILSINVCASDYLQTGVDWNFSPRKDNLCAFSGVSYSKPVSVSVYQQKLCAGC